jgi:hypothetical protein
MDAVRNNSASGTKTFKSLIQTGRFKAAATGIQLALNTSKWTVVMKCTEPFGAIKCREYIDQPRNCLRTEPFPNSYPTNDSVPSHSDRATGLRFSVGGLRHGRRAFTILCPSAKTDFRCHLLCQLPTNSTDVCPKATIFQVPAATLIRYYCPVQPPS